MLDYTTLLAASLKLLFLADTRLNAHTHQYSLARIASKACSRKSAPEVHQAPVMYEHICICHSSLQAKAQGPLALRRALEEKLGCGCQQSSPNRRGLGCEAVRNSLQQVRRILLTTNHGKSRSDQLAKKCFSRASTSSMRGPASSGRLASSASSSRRDSCCYLQGYTQLPRSAHLHDNISSIQICITQAEGM